MFSSANATLALALLGALSACAHSPATTAAAVAGSTPEAEDIARARSRGNRRTFPWEPYSPETFARAKRERRYILLDGAAEWCHWCHVMDESTYADPEIGRILESRFVAIRVDIDENPEIAERYADWGWPATILFSPDAEELGKFRGYLPVETLRAALASIGNNPESGSRADTLPVNDPPASSNGLPWIAARTLIDLDARYDHEQGGWGTRQKLPIGENVEVELRRAAHGDGEARRRALFTLDKERALIDPAWGGIYQYSGGSDWHSPHFEKRMVYQAPNLEAWARAYALTHDPAWLRDAQRIAHYMIEFLGAPDGTFYVNQDADLGAHDAGGRFVDGHAYYALSETARRALGLPWVDKHIYARENGMAISALCTLFEVSSDGAMLERARRAAEAILSTHLLDDGTVLHDAAVRAAPYYLADAAAFGRALARLHQITHEPRYRDKALLIAKAMDRNFSGGAAGVDAWFDHSLGEGAAGVFLRREAAFSPNVSAARFVALVAQITADSDWTARARRALAAIATPRTVSEQGRLIGDFFLALDDIGEPRWPSHGKEIPRP